MEYGEAVEYIESRLRFGVRLGLERITLLLHALGDPQTALRFIHIGGTNGKGSTAAMLASILRAAGYRTGLFVSPHLESYTERFSIGGETIPKPVFASLVQEIRFVVEKNMSGANEQPTEFEVLTAMAFLYFQRQAVDLVVLEVGLGGESDSTNVVQDPLVSIITNIGYDHMDRLGDTLTGIARAKAGIIKPGGYVITAVSAPEILSVIEERSRLLGASLLVVGFEADWEPQESLPQGQYFSAGLRGRVYPRLFLPLLGRHQLVNALTALLAIEVLRNHRGLYISEEAVAKGLAEVRWPGRVEIAGSQPLIILDVAHNREGAEALREALAQFHYRDLFLVIALLRDKERERVVEILASGAKAVVVTKALDPRAGDWGEVAVLAGRYTSEVYLEPVISQALVRARNLAGPSDLILVTGSFYMVGEARSHLVKERPPSESEN